MSSDPPATVWRNLYLHVPFCASKCGYCAFYSETQSSLALRKKYLQRVSEKIAQSNFPESLQSVYIGGGTPNLLTSPELAELFEMIYQYVPLADNCEISCELNPELLTAEKCRIINEYATRVSLGVQSFEESVRNKLMRHCSQEHLSKALKLLEKRTVKHFNIDLIYAVSGVPWSTFQADLQKALAQGVDHLSCYALTAEENSRLGLQSPVADDCTGAEWWHQIGDFLDQNGMARYEISNYAVPGGECKHNVDVWRGGTLLGVGAAAAGFDGVDRYTYPESVEDFIAGCAAEVDRIAPAMRMLEIWAVNLRTVRGWNRENWEKLYPGSWNKMKFLSTEAARENPAWWQIENDHIALSADGMLFWDDAAMQILDWEGFLR